MNSNTGEKMAGIPTATPGSAEGEADLDLQSKVPPSSHTPGSAEGEADQTEAVSSEAPRKLGETS